MFLCNVSNPAQNRAPRPAMINWSERRNARRSLSTPAAYPCDRTVPEQWEKERRWIDGTRFSSVPQSAAQTSSFHHCVVWEAVGETKATGAGVPVAKDVSVLRVNHFTRQNVLLRVWEYAQPSLAVQFMRRPDPTLSVTELRTCHSGEMHKRPLLRIVNAMAKNFMGDRSNKSNGKQLSW